MNKSISTLPIDKNVVQKLMQSSISKVKDLLAKTPMDLVKMLNVSLPKAESILDHAFKCSPVNPINLIDLLESNQIETSFDDDSFDKVINENELTRKGLICELCGPPGVGKTQFTTQLCVNHLFKNFKSSNSKLTISIIYIDTENNFSTKRLLEIAEYKFKNQDEIIEMSKNLFVFKAFTLNDFEKIMDKLENYIIEYNVDLVIIDSLASIVRKEYAGSDGSILQERAIFLYKISSNLKIIAEYLNVSIIITNHIVNYSSRSYALNSIDDSTVIPALGSTWTHFVNIRVILQFFNDESRELLIAKSPLSPFKRYSYYIESNGLLFNEFEIYDGTNPSFQTIRTKPFSNTNNRP